MAHQDTQSSTPWSLFLDDERFPVDDGQNWKIARTVEEAHMIISEFGMPAHIAFDHDLGPEERTGFDFAQDIVNADLDGKIKIDGDLTFYVHSQNPVGRKNIEALMTNYLSHIAKR